MIADPRQHPVESVRVGVIEEINIERIVGVAERICDKLRAERRAANANEQDVFEFPAAFRRDFPGVNVGGELLNPRVRLVDVSAQFGIGREFRIAQPIMAHHPAFVRIRDRARFQFAHGRERFFHERLHLPKESVPETHPADVDGKIEILVGKKIFLEARPERRRSHDVLLTERST